MKQNSVPPFNSLQFPQTVIRGTLHVVIFAHTILPNGESIDLRTSKNFQNPMTARFSSVEWEKILHYVIVVVSKINAKMREIQARNSNALYGCRTYSVRIIYPMMKMQQLKEHLTLNWVFSKAHTANVYISITTSILLVDCTSLS